MIWLFSPPKKKHALPSTNSRMEVVNIPVQQISAQEAKAAHEPDSTKDQQKAVAAASSPDSSLGEASKGNPDHSQIVSLYIGKASRRKPPTSLGARHLSVNASRPAILHPRYKTSFWKEVADFGNRLRLLWRRSGSAARHPRKTRKMSTGPKKESAENKVDLQGTVGQFSRAHSQSSQKDRFSACRPLLERDHQESDRNQLRVFKNFSMGPGGSKRARNISMSEIQLRREYDANGLLSMPCILLLSGASIRIAARQRGG